MTSVEMNKHQKRERYDGWIEQDSNQGKLAPESIISALQTICRGARHGAYHKLARSPLVVFRHVALDWGLTLVMVFINLSKRI